MKDHVPLCVAIIDALLLLERSSPDEIEPDIAVFQFTQTSGILF
jgi:hypothetical protein